MTVTFRPAKRENVPLLIGIAGGTGSGKTMSALRIARGIADGHPIAAVDTENGRMSHYADEFPELRIADLAAPFRPGRYAEAIEAAEKYLEQQNVPRTNRVIVVDSASHEWAGDGGCLDWHDELMDGDQKKNLSAWIEPKKAHKRMVTRLLQVNAHVILCFRAEPKVEAIRENGATKIIAKPSLTGLDGWIPISEKMLPYELTASFLVMADNPGVPRPIKLEQQHRPFVPLDRELDEEVGKSLAGWARGGATTGMSVEEFNAARHQAGISDEAVGEVGARIFPGKSLADISDTDRAQLFAELQRAPSRREDGNGQAGEEDATGAEHAQASPDDADGTSPPADAAFTPPASAGSDVDPDIQAANTAGEYMLPVGKHKGVKLADILDQPDGESYLRYLLRQWKTDPLKSHAWAFARVYAPDLYEECSTAEVPA